MTKLWTLVALTALTTTACGGAYDENGEPLDDEDVETGEVEQAATNISNCATGSTANAQLNITSWGTSDSYARYADYPNSICGSSSHDTTYVDVPVSSNYVYEYHFVVTPSGPNWSVSTAAQCANLGFATRVQRQLSNGDWESIKYVESYGVWLPGYGCIKPPQFSWDRVNNGETGKYRVRTWAKGKTGAHVDVTVVAANFGPP